MIEEGECSANTVEHESMQDNAGKKNRSDAVRKGAKVRKGVTYTEAVTSSARGLSAAVRSGGRGRHGGRERRVRRVAGCERRAWSPPLALLCRRMLQSEEAAGGVGGAKHTRRPTPHAGGSTHAAGRGRAIKKGDRAHRRAGIACGWLVGWWERCAVRSRATGGREGSRAVDCVGCGGCGHTHTGVGRTPPRVRGRRTHSARAAGAHPPVGGCATARAERVG